MPHVAALVTLVAHPTWTHTVCVSLSVCSTSSSHSNNHVPNNNVYMINRQRNLFALAPYQRNFYTQGGQGTRHMELNESTVVKASLIVCHHHAQNVLLFIAHHAVPKKKKKKALTVSHAIICNNCTSLFKNAGKVHLHNHATKEQRTCVQGDHVRATHTRTLQQPVVVQTHVW